MNSDCSTYAIDVPIVFGALYTVISGYSSPFAPYEMPTWRLLMLIGFWLDMHKFFVFTVLCIFLVGHAKKFVHITLFLCTS